MSEMKDETKDVVYKFDHDLLFIDVSIAENPDIYKICVELGELLDEVSSCVPYSDEPWAEYVRDRVGDWNYLRVHKSHGRFVGTASDEVPGERDVLLAQEFIDVVKQSFHNPTEDFDAIFD